MALEDSNLAEIQREIKGFGDNVKALETSMQRDLAAVRQIAESAKASAANPEVKSQIETLQTSVAEKHSALEKLVGEMKQRSEGIELALKRTPGNDPADQARQAKDALSFFEAKAAATGEMKISNRPKLETIDMDSYRSWEGAFDTYLRVKDDRMIEAKALSVASNPDGGYLVPTAVSARIIQKVWETSPIRQLATVETIGTSELEIAIDEDEGSAGWVGETESRPETGTPPVGVQKIPVHEIYAKPRATAKLLEDAAVNMEAWLGRKTSEKFGRVEASAFVVGNGVKRPRGVLTYPAGDGRGKIKQLPSGHVSQLTADGLVTMTYSLKEPYLANSGWLMKRGTVGAVAILKDSQGQYLWRPGLEPGKPSVLLGYPVRQADDMPAVGAAALPVLFGDLREGYTVVDRLGITTLRDPFSAKPFVEFYSRKRVGGDVTNFEAFLLMVIST